jgi:hypothetical protein
MSSIEILISLTILIILMAGINAILVTKAKINNYHKDVNIAADLSQQALDNIKNQASNLSNYLNFEQNIETNLINPPFLINNTDPSFRDKFVGSLTVQSSETRTSKDTTPGNNVVIFLDKSPTKVGIFETKSVTIYNILNGVTETVFVKKVNDSSNNIQIDDTSPENGRSGLINYFPKGSVVIGNGKAIKVEIYYADPTNKNIRDKNRDKPLSSSTTLLSFPFGSK